MVAVSWHWLRVFVILATFFLVSIHVSMACSSFFFGATQGHPFAKATGLFSSLARKAPCLDVLKSTKPQTRSPKP